MKTAVILQPGYLPWLGFFEQVHRSDNFIFYDDVQYTTNDWRNRNRIKTDRGAAWLTVPVERCFPISIREARIDNRSGWRSKHVKTLRQYYGKAPFFDRFFPALERIYEKEWMFICDLDTALIREILSELGVRREIYFSSELGEKGEKSERLVRLCRRVGADVYYSGKAAAEYLDEKLFAESGIQVTYQDYNHPVYRQLHGEFVPHLSVVDLLFNEGPDSLGILAPP